MQVKEIMCKKAEFLPPTASLKEAAKLMKSNDYGFIPIGESDRLVGAVTDRDIVIRAIAEGKDINQVTLGEIMSKGIQYCFEDEDLKTVAQKMEKLQVRRLVVLNKDKRMIGIISLGDIATKAKNATLCSRLTEAVSAH
jgi:CBS domain-containing protein